MGKRSNYEREELDFYPTPLEALLPLLPLLPKETAFCEPCAGDGRLITMLHSAGHRCVAAFDVKPKHDSIRQLDATFMSEQDMQGADMIITNPPWGRDVLHQIINRCLLLRPAWLLFDADWAHTKQAIPLMEKCTDIVAVRRVKWVEGSSGAGKDNCCWYRFDASSASWETRFRVV